MSSVTNRTTGRPRAVIVARVTHQTEEGESADRQVAVCEKFCAEQGFEIAGYAVDRGVSGRLDPLVKKNRPELAKWLNRGGEFQRLVFWRMDRLCRGMVNTAKMLGWAEENDVLLMSATEPAFDFTTRQGELTASIAGWSGTQELDGMSARASLFQQSKITNGVHRGGPLPLGYRHEGKCLVPDEDRVLTLPDGTTVEDDGLANVARDIVKRVIEGQPMAKIVRDLNAAGIPTPKTRQAILNGREPRLTKSGEPLRWSISNLGRMLASPSLIGQSVYRPPVFNKDGSPKRVAGKRVYLQEQPVMQGGKPLQRAEPLVSEEDFATVQKIFKDRKENAPGQKLAAEPTLLLGVMDCDCGEPYWHLRGGMNYRSGNRRKDRYRCASHTRHGACGSGSFVEAEANDAVVSILFAFMGDVPHVVKQWQPGSDNAAEMARIDATLNRYVAMMPVLPAGSSAFDEAIAEMQKLKERFEELSALPSEPSGYKYIRTETTFREHWDSLDAAGKNAYLRDNGVRVIASKREGKERFDITFGEVFEMIRVVNPEAGDALEGDGWGSYIARIEEALHANPHLAEKVEVHRNV